MATLEPWIVRTLADLVTTLLSSGSKLLAHVDSDFFAMGFVVLYPWFEA
jgi:hypothetical protein